MSMTGGISFYDKSKCLFDNGASAVASSNTDDQNLCLGTNKYFKWQSDGSDDTTTETLTITLPTSTAISRLFILNHNLKAFQVKYGASLDFANVTGLDSYSDSLIDVTGFNRNTAYFEFDSVTTDTIIITMDTTQTADDEKYIGQVIVTNELGTLEGYPEPKNIVFDRNISKQESISGRNHIQKGFESFSFDLDLKTYPKQNDIDLLQALHDRENSFLVWPCGGLPDQFRIKQKGFYVQDLYNVQIDISLKNSYPKGVYLMGVNQSYSFKEVV